MVQSTGLFEDFLGTLVKYRRCPKDITWTIFAFYLGSVRHRFCACKIASLIKILVRIWSILVVVIIFRRTKHYSSHKLNYINHTHIPKSIWTHIYTDTKLLKMPNSLKLGLNLKCSLFWTLWNIIALFH
jgi:hypothetical protein